MPLEDDLAVGLLGGSFNPAHEGHLLISRLALARLRLDQVWWLVSPQNPLKPADGMAPLDERLAGARRLARHPRIRAGALEARLGTRYTADTIAALQARFPRTRFVWLMGADNLIQIPAWRDWRRIFERVPVAIFARPSYSLRALSGEAAQSFRRHRIAESASGELAAMAPPAWVFFHTRLSEASGTLLRTMGARRQKTQSRRNREESTP